MKEHLRQDLKKWCHDHMDDFNASYAHRIADIVDKLVGDVFPDTGYIGCYHPLKDEVDVRPLIGLLRLRGHSIALPAVVQPKTPLQFRLCKPGEPLERDAMGLLVPNILCDVVVPDLVIVPMLGFSPQQYRIGRGGGYYDRTLECYPGMIAIGVAAMGQKTDFTPEPHDKKLHHIVTEDGVWSS